MKNTKMDINGTMTITLELFDDSFEAEAHIKFLDDPVREVSFILNNDLCIESITSSNRSVSFYKQETVEQMFRPLSQKITAAGSFPMSEIDIRYNGSIHFDEANQKNWHNEITEDFVSLNWYSVWFPDSLSVNTSDDKVIIKNGHKWFVVKGEYHDADDVWIYGNQESDRCNIVAFSKEKLHTVISPAVDIFYIDESIKDTAEKCVDIYNSILQYYNNILFDKKVISKMDIVCAYPYIKTGGAYQRENLVWCTVPDSDEAGRTYLFAHEIAHIWCCGADCGSWEDWLNETTADWSALLFALYRNDRSLFDNILKPKIELYDKLPAIKTSDGSRPDGVHEKGTVLFYQVYQKYGYDTMVEIVRCFSRLKQKNTKELIDGLIKIGLRGAADMIAEGINYDRK